MNIVLFRAAGLFLFSCKFMNIKEHRLS